MVAIRAACPTCGEVVLSAKDITLLVCVNKEACTYYKFLCPDCITVIRKFADDYVQGQLKLGGVEPVTWKVPDEALETHKGPPLTLDDLLDLGIALYMSDSHPLESL